MWVLAWKIILAAAVVIIAIHYAVEGARVAHDAYRLGAEAFRTDAKRKELK